MNRLLHTPAAQADLLSYYRDLTTEFGEALAAQGLEALLDRCEDLARFPDMGRRRPELDSFGIQTRGISHDGRLIVYAKRCDTVHIVRILRT